MGQASASRRRIVGACACVLAASLACTVDAPDDSLGTLTGPPMPTAGTPTGGGDDGSGDDDGSAGDDGSADDGDDGSGSGDDGGGSGSDSNAGSDGGSAGDSGGDAGAQPQDGVYSACMTAAECVGAIYCIPANDGFCTGNCMAPADCPPSPNGAAPAVCIPITAPVATTVCAIDCSGGQTCPAPMTCGSVEGSMVCV